MPVNVPRLGHRWSVQVVITNGNWPDSVGSSRQHLTDDASYKKVQAAVD
jgi:hypothetical protein